LSDMKSTIFLLIPLLAPPVAVKHKHKQKYCHSWLVKEDRGEGVRKSCRWKLHSKLHPKQCLRKCDYDLAQTITKSFKKEIVWTRVGDSLRITGLIVRSQSISGIGYSSSTIFFMSWE